MNYTCFVLENLDWYEGGQFVPDIFEFSFSQKSQNISIAVYEQSHPGPFMPFWQSNPLPTFSLINWNALSLGNQAATKKIVDSLGEAVVGDMLSAAAVSASFPSPEDQNQEPHSLYYQPVFDSFDETTKTIVGQVQVLLQWNVYFKGNLPDDVSGIYVVLENTCNSSGTWELEGKNATYIGKGDLHDKAYDSYKITSSFNTYKNENSENLARELGACLYTMTIYPSSSFEDNYTSNNPIAFTMVVAAVFISIIVAFLAYDSFQRKRNTKVVANAAKSNALVSSLFPSNIRDRLLDPAKASKPTTNTKKLQTFLERGGEDIATGHDQPIADLFLETTIMFADITDFTAWSSMREPSQVFTLLETVFSALDRLAKKRRIFKVETVGDCYVAVAGLPEPRKDHALAMARFASDALLAMQVIVKRLELTLGPDTGDLGFRIGLHSGVGKIQI